MYVCVCGHKVILVHTPGLMSELGDTLLRKTQALEAAAVPFQMGIAESYIGDILISIKDVKSKFLLLK